MSGTTVQTSISVVYQRLFCTKEVVQGWYKMVQNPYAKRPKTYFQNSILGIEST